MDAPIDGRVVTLTAAKASVPPARLPALAERVQAVLESDRGRYRRTCERVHADETLEVYLIEEDHWAELADDLAVSDRELSAIRRLHEEQLVWTGRRTDRETAFETALEIRSALCLRADSSR